MRTCPGGGELGSGSDTSRVAALKSVLSRSTMIFRVDAGRLPAAHSRSRGSTLRTPGSEGVTAGHPHNESARCAHVAIPMHGAGLRTRTGRGPEVDGGGLHPLAIRQHDEDLPSLHTRNGKN